MSVRYHSTADSSIAFPMYCRTLTGGLATNFNGVTVAEDCRSLVDLEFEDVGILEVYIEDDDMHGVVDNSSVIESSPADAPLLIVTQRRLCSSDEEALAMVLTVVSDDLNLFLLVSSQLIGIVDVVRYLRQ